MEQKPKKEGADKPKEKLTYKERGKRFFKKLSEQGPNHDRVGQTFVRTIKPKK
tara:strand:+ start:164 stop:322 length:159 start_codon:yes stop_codon:yes gene_type:complete